MQVQRAAAVGGGVVDLDPDDLELMEESERERILPAFLGVTSAPTSLHYIPPADHGKVPAHVFDEETGMVYVLD